ncbi:aspartate carbamoyltransferase catalytic subunit [Puniceicoccales bacterium CK1056]|uniref:Aspartate carbamoyltransferase n=1 Tax=Oceanipulchritudo coccoides TaxID=2706888 RepID=A0A6B2M5K8_9BACT|nr:aspartate carbamoyltransferase catalytic subunit [Oceanipulchritudo coccoides]NDV63459.1 aspartate carbamoyltransferase catalytic subunit [Oceanipulchritudo coccoides]
MNELIANWTRKDLISIESLTREEIDTVHALAKHFKEIMATNPASLPSLRGRTILNLFIEPSTRTRIAFEIAAKRLGADVTLVEQAASSLTKGESLRDTAQVVEALQADTVVLRHSAAGSPLYLSKILNVPVINAGDGAHEHPTQALLDTFTMREKLGQSLEGKKITILGDILFSRVARSNIFALNKLGASVTLSGPATLVPDGFRQLGVEVDLDLKSALADADVVMLLRIQHERQTSTHFPSLGEYKSLYGLNQERASWLKPDAIIMHPGPVNRGVELDSSLADSNRSVILQQVANGIFNRMAVIYLCMAANNKNLISE